MIEQFFTTEQVAKILQVHPFTILKFIREGKLPGIKLGRVYRIKESEVSRFLEERSVGGGAAKRAANEKPQKTMVSPATAVITSSSSSDNAHFPLEPKKSEGKQYYSI